MHISKCNLMQWAHRLRPVSPLHAHMVMGINQSPQPMFAPGAPQAVLWQSIMDSYLGPPRTSWFSFLIWEPAAHERCSASWSAELLRVSTLRGTAQLLYEHEQDFKDSHLFSFWDNFTLTSGNFGFVLVPNGRRELLAQIKTNTKTRYEWDALGARH